MQLVNNNVKMLDPMKNKKIGINEVVDKFGVEPDKVIQIQALTGDKIDNIPGAPGIGPKTALELINEFGDVASLIKNSKKIKQEKRKQIIQESENDIRISLELVKLENNVKLPLGKWFNNLIETSSKITNSETCSKFKTPKLTGKLIGLFLILNKLSRAFLFGLHPKAGKVDVG